VYYAIQSHRLILLCEGGDKRTQAADINQAIERWQDWQRRSKP
jgi:putative component of toxin-antitoxin plasmid stabilization module